MAGDIFLKITGIDGESKDSKFPNHIQCETFAWGAMNPTSMAWGTGGGVGKVQLQDCSITKVTDKSSAKLFLACCGGDHIDEATFIFRKAGKEQQAYLKIKLEDLMVATIGFHDHSAGHELAKETVSFSYAKIHFEYRPQIKDGTLGDVIPSGWDQKANVKT